MADLERIPSPVSCMLLCVSAPKPEMPGMKHCIKATSHAASPSLDKIVSEYYYLGITAETVYPLPGGSHIVET